jgi:hypothetical protein
VGGRCSTARSDLRGAIEVRATGTVTLDSADIVAAIRLTSIWTKDRSCWYVGLISAEDPAPLVAVLPDGQPERLDRL